MTTPDVSSITAAETRPLRAALLRPGQPPENLIYDGDEAATSFHAGAYHDGRLVGIATVYPEAPPEAHRDVILGEKAFRLRGMATTPEVRGAGYGLQAP